MSSGAVARAHRLLGLDDDGAPVDLAQVRELIDALRERLGAEELAASPVAEQEGALERLRQRFEARFQALERIQTAVGALREVTSPRQVLVRAPAALCAGSRFERAILSLVAGGRMVADAVYCAGAGQEQAAAGPSWPSSRPIRCGSSTR